MKILSAERRRYHRLHYRILCEFRSDAEFYAGIVEDISQEGFFIYTEYLQELEEKVELIIHADEIYSVEARVCWRRHPPKDRSKGLPPGMGVEILNPPKHHLEFVKELEHRFVVNNRKSEPRYRTSQKVEFESEANFLTAYTENLSRGGFYISSNEELKPGSVIQAQLDIPGMDEPLKVEGKVTHYLPEDKAMQLGKKAGAGVQFIELSTKARNILFHFVKRLQVHRHTPDRKQVELPKQGTLTDYLLPELLVGFLHQKITGSLRIQRQGIEKRIFFQQGVPFFVDSSLRAEMFSNFLVRKGILMNHEVILILEEMEHSDLKFGELLLQNNLMDSSRLQDLLTEHQEEKISNMFPWFEGDYLVENQVDWPDYISFFPLDTYRILDNGVEQWFGTEVIRAWVGLDERTLLIGRKRASTELELPSSIFKLLRFTSIPISVEELGVKMNLTVDEIIRRSFVALLSDCLEITAERYNVEESHKEIPIPEKKTYNANLVDVLAKKIQHDFDRMQSLNFYKVLGVEPSDSKADIKAKFYERLGKYPFDLIQGIDDKKIQDKGEKIIQLLRLAYNTLSNDSLRQIYSSQSPQKINNKNRKLKIQMERELFKAIGLIDQENYAEAISILEKANDKFYSDGSLKGYLAWARYCHNKDKNVESSIELMKKALESETMDTQLLYYCGKMFVHQKKWKPAEKMFQRVIKLNPRFIQAEAEYERAKNYRILEERQAQK